MTTQQRPRLAAIACTTCLLSFCSSAFAVTYALDDGTQEAGIGYFGTTGTVWLNEFTVTAGGERIESIEIMFGANPASNGLPANGESFQLLLYTDADNDGDPSNATLVRQQTEQISQSNTSTFVSYNLDTPVDLGTGDSFYIGMYRAADGSSNSFGPNTDTNGAMASRSYRFGWFPSGNAPDPGDLSSAGNSVNPETTRNFMIRAEGTAVPEPSSALLLGFACSGLLLRRRKKQV